MAGIDETRPFVAVRIAVLTVSDTRDESSDRSGAVLVQRLQEAGHVLAAKEIVTDDQPLIEGYLRDWIASQDVDVVLLTGGTGITARDVTPEAVHAVMDKHIAGFGELFRWLSYDKIGTSTI